VAKRILVLSGGGLWGAFQAGAWSVIEQHARFDGVVGASAGALNACAIAGGMSGAGLERLWLESADAARLRWRWPRYWLDGVVDTRALEHRTVELLRGFAPRMEIGVVVSQGWTLRQVLVRDVSVDAVMASCAIPFALPAKRIGGVLSVDGGLRAACPMFAAYQMGATEVLAVNVWTHLPWWWVGWGRGSADGVLAPCIEPPERLGPLRTSAIWEDGNIARWIAMGRQAAEAHFARQ